MASIQEKGGYDWVEWTSRTYPFKAQHVGKSVYKGRAIAETGSWEGQAQQTGYITLDGTLQTLQWKVGGQHRPVRLVLMQTDSGYNPSAANYNMDYYYRDTALGIADASMWEEIDSQVPGTATYTGYYGETYERQTSEYRLTLQGTSGNQAEKIEGWNRRISYITAVRDHAEPDPDTGEYPPEVKKILDNVDWYLCDAEIERQVARMKRICELGQRSLICSASRFDP